MRSAKRAWVLLLLAAACPSPVLSGCSSGGADGSLDLRGATDGGTDLGPAAAPASFLSPSTMGPQATWPREVVYTLDAPKPATIYYTLDGSEPQSGAASTRSGKAPLTLDRPFGEGTLRWFADYGAGFLREPARSLQAHVDTARARTDLGSLTERVAFDGSGGPVVTVDAGAELRGSLIYQVWRSAPTGSCPSCQLQYVLFVEKSGVTPVLCIDLVNSYGTYPGKTQSLPFTFTVPAVPGQYLLRAGLTLQGSCNGTVPVTYADVGLIIVRPGHEPPV
jgi:hypothetical protein